MKYLQMWTISQVPMVSTKHWEIMSVTQKYFNLKKKKKKPEV